MTTRATVRRDEASRTVDVLSCPTNAGTSGRYERRTPSIILFGLAVALATVVFLDNDPRRAKAAPAAAGDTINSMQATTKSANRWFLVVVEKVLIVILYLSSKELYQFLIATVEH